jgi:hypothetical protein
MRLTRRTSLLTLKVCAATFAAFALTCTIARADTSVQTQTLTCTIDSAASLTMAEDTVTFDPHNPAAMASIAADENGSSTITSNATTLTDSTVTLTVEAGSALTDLTSDTIAADNVTYTCTGAGYVGGTLSSSAPTSVGSWTGPGTHVGAISYFLANSFNYSTGVYTATLTYTLTAP